MLLGKFSGETWEVIKLASPFIINAIAGTIPPVIMINFMMTEAFNEGIGPEVGVYVHKLVLNRILTWNAFIRKLKSWLA